MLTNVVLEEAIDSVLGNITPLTGEFVPLLDAVGRVLFQDMFAVHDLPPYPRAAVDGYALPVGAAGECKSFIITESLKPGEMPSFPLGPGQAAGVVTGGPLPDGTGTVVPDECTRVKDGRVNLLEEIEPGSDIKLPGEDFHAGDLLARRGTAVTPGLVGALAAYGKSEVMVYRRPRAALLSLGPEIVSGDVVPEPGQMRDSNGPLLAALVQRDGGTVTCVDVAGSEDLPQLGSHLQNLLQQADVVFTTGGTASGICDHSLYLLRLLGARPLFRGVKVKPGSHSTAAVYKNKLIISLSGNPAACAVGYFLLCAPVVRALQGLSPYPRRLTAVCKNPFEKRGGPRRFVQGYADCGQGNWQVSILPGQKSSMLRPLINCNALIELPAGHPPLEEGAEVSVILV